MLLLCVLLVLALAPARAQVGGASFTTEQQRILELLVVVEGLGDVIVSPLAHGAPSRWRRAIVSQAQAGAFRLGGEERGEDALQNLLAQA